MAKRNQMVEMGNGLDHGESDLMTVESGSEQLDVAFFRRLSGDRPA
ncbi:MAG: hypothetical protein ABSC37_03610 [Xanthobacteraceae bacterium]